MDDTQAKIDWLVENGYYLENFIGGYRFIYRKGDYAASMRLDMHEILEMDIELIKHRHKLFIELAEKETIF